MNTKEALTLAIPTALGASLGAFFGPKGIALGAGLGAVAGAALVHHDAKATEEAPALSPTSPTPPEAPSPAPPIKSTDGTSWFPSTSLWVPISTEASRAGADAKTSISKGSIVFCTMQFAGAPSSSERDMCIVRASIDVVTPFVSGSSVSAPIYGGTIVSVESKTELTSGVVPPSIGQRIVLSPDRVWKIEA